MIIGAFAAGLLVVSAPQTHEIERGITEIGHFFVPLFFVAVGASVDLSALDPFQPASRFALMTGGVLIVVGVAGKLAAGYAPFWFRGNKTVIGVGMVPRGEVGLIFAQMGLATKVFDAGLFGAVTLMVIVTTLLAPPCLKYSWGRSPDRSSRTMRSTESKTSSPKPEITVRWVDPHQFSAFLLAHSLIVRIVGIQFAYQRNQCDHHDTAPNEGTTNLSGSPRGRYHAIMSEFLWRDRLTATSP